MKPDRPSIPLFSFLLAFALITPYATTGVCAEEGQDPDRSYMWIEAESGAEYHPIVVKSDPEASQDIYLASWQWSNDGVITFSIEISARGSYLLWGRMKNPANQAQPYSITLNENQDAALWQASGAASEKTWFWSEFGHRLDLDAGTHHLHFRQNTGGPELKLDKILITNDDFYTPIGKGGSETEIDTESTYRSNTVNTHGQLAIQENQLVDQHGNAVQLKGISTHGLQWFPLVKNNTIPHVAEFFGVEAIRLAMYIEEYAPENPLDYWGGYMADSEAMYARVTQAIEDAIEAGIYVLVDWHIHNQPLNFSEPAIDFFHRISRQYGSYPNIIYEIANEPKGVNWSSGIKPYAESIITTIRQNDPDNIILVGTPNWSQDVDDAASDPLNYDNIMYSFHFYAATHNIQRMKDKVDAALSAGLAIFVSEWGTSDVGTSTSNFSIAHQWMAFMNDRGLSWINWSLGNKDETSSILLPSAPLSGPWDETDLTASGTWIKKWFHTSGNGYIDTPSSPPHRSDNLEPQISDIDTSASFGQTSNITLEGYDEDGQITEWLIERPPEHGSINIENNQAIYTPHTNFSGTDSFDYVAKDNNGALSSKATVYVNVLAQALPGEDNNAPVDCIVSDNVWGDGYVATFSIHNNGNIVISAWSITISTPNGESIVNAWNAEIDQEDESGFIASNMNHNGQIPPGGSTSFGYQANYQGAYQTPTCYYTLNP